MAVEITLPRQSEKLDESLITFWHVSEGDSVEVGDTIVEVQTEKAVTEVQATESGVVQEIVKKRGETVTVGEVLALLDNGTKEEVTEEDHETNKNTKSEKKATPRVKKLAEALEVDWKLITPSRNDGKITEEEVRSFAEAREVQDVETDAHVSSQPSRKVLATPAIRKYARDNDMEVENAHQAYISEGQSDSGSDEADTRVALTGVRKMVAKTMTHSKNAIPHVTHFDEANVKKLVELREMLKEEFQDEGVKLTYMAFVLKALANVLFKYPYLNASFDEENEEILLKRQYHIGFATDTDQGLLVPVLRNADKQSLFSIAKNIQELASKAKIGDITSDEMADGTATVSNVGSAHGAFFTPIINPPQSSILGIGRIEKKAIVTDDDTIEIQPRMALSLSYDHRAIDGMMAQESINELKRLLEEPGLLLAY